MEELIKSFIDFHKKAEKLKTTTRHSWLTNSSRQESVAEHSWMICLLAIVLAPKLDSKVDLLKVLKMLIIHDLAESITGDFPDFSVKPDYNKYPAEEQALRKIVERIPKDRANEIMNLWQGFEKRNSMMPKFANALDKREAIMQHNLADIKTWEDGDFLMHPYYKDSFFDFDSFMRAFKDVVDNQSMEKIITEKVEHRIDSKHVDRYNKNKSK